MILGYVTSSITSFFSWFIFFIFLFLFPISILPAGLQGYLLEGVSLTNDVLVPSSSHRAAVNYPPKTVDALKLLTFHINVSFSLSCPLSSRSCLEQRFSIRPGGIKLWIPAESTVHPVASAECWHPETSNTLWWTRTMSSSTAMSQRWPVPTGNASWWFSQAGANTGQSGVWQTVQRALRVLRSIQSVFFVLSSLITVLVPLFHSDPMEIPSNEAHIPSNLKTLNQYSIAEINHRLKNYLKFLFVREPFERLVSAYRNKFTLKYNSSFHKRFGTRIIRRYRKNATQDALLNGADVKFKEFAEYLVDPATQRDGPLNEHWQTVYQLCHPCHIHYDLVGKYDTLEDDANYVLRLVGVGDSLRFPSYAKSTRTTDAMTAQFFSNISTQQQVQLYQLYKMDFLMFNYSTPSYLRLD